MKFETYSISAPDRKELETWFTSRGAKLFLDLVQDEMQTEYLLAIDKQVKIGRVEDKAKFDAQAVEHITKAEDLKNLMSLFEQFSDPKYEFKRLKTL